MSLLTVFGLISVSTMLVAYAWEAQSRAFVLLFAAACAASSAYGFLAGTWPFGIVEAVWTAVALRRWARTSTQSEPHGERPIACDMTALSNDERRRYDVLRPRVLEALEHVHETVTGFRLRIGSAVSIHDVTEWLDMEHRCCGFFDIHLTLKSDGTRWIEMGGSAPIKAFLKDEFLW